MKRILVLETLLVEKGIVGLKGCAGNTKNRSQLARPKRVLKRFAEVESVEGRRREEEGVVVWSEAVLWGGQ